MKTPHTITLIYSDNSEPQFNPITGEYEGGESVEKHTPCLFQFLSKSKQFEEYGTRDEVIANVWFMQEQEPFQKAKYDNQTFVPIEKIDAPTKGAVRMQEVVE